MKYKYIDGHAHLNTNYFKEEIKDALELAKKYNVTKMIMPSTCVEDSYKSIKIAKKYENLFATVGIHPADGFNIKECDYLDQINPKDIVAVGEVGIDLYRKENPVIEIQKKIFEKHIKFAKKHNKVLIVHMREGPDEVAKLLEKYLPLKFVMHSFTESYAWALKFIKMGGYISFSGIVTFKNAFELKEVAKKLPLDKILTETDAPFLTPVPQRGKQNTPAYVKYTTDFIANIRDESDGDVINAIYNNAIKLYGI